MALGFLERSHMYAILPNVNISYLVLPRNQRYFTKFIYVQVEGVGLTFMGHYMALAVDITDGCGLSSKVHHDLLLKKSKVMLYLPFIPQ